MTMNDSGDVTDQTPEAAKAAKRVSLVRGIDDAREIINDRIPEGRAYQAAWSAHNAAHIAAGEAHIDAEQAERAFAAEGALPTARTRKRMHDARQAAHDAQVTLRGAEEAHRAARAAYQETAADSAFDELDGLIATACVDRSKDARARVSKAWTAFVDAMIALEDTINVSNEHIEAARELLAQLRNLHDASPGTSAGDRTNKALAQCPNGQLSLHALSLQLSQALALDPSGATTLEGIAKRFAPPPPPPKASHNGSYSEGVLGVVRKVLGRE